MKQYNEFEHVFAFLKKKKIDSQAFQYLDIPTFKILKNRKIVKKYSPMDRSIKMKKKKTAT